MTLMARRALADCVVAHELLEKNDREDPAWRVHWVACLALLRTVGHVLDKVDGAHTPEHRAAIDATWTAWKGDRKRHAIFWLFIECERNSLLKQYEFGVEPEPTYVVTEDGDRLVTEDGDALVTEDDFFRLSVAGFEDQDGRDVIREAIDWWKHELDAVDARIRRAP